MQNSLQRSAYEKNRLIDTKVSQEGERGDGPGTGPEIPLEKTIVR